MYCNQCGAAVGANDTVCPSCGRSTVTGRMDFAARMRVGEHLHLLGVLWFVMTALSVIPGIVMVFLATAAGAFMPGNGPEKTVAPILFGGLAVIFFIYAFGNFAAGLGLMKVAPWGRAVALVMAFINLLHAPFGTALGIYTLFVLLPEAAGDEYRKLASSSETEKLRVVTAQRA